MPSEDSFPNWPPEWPEIAESVANCVTDGTWGLYRGPASAELAQRLAELVGRQHCRLVSSGSVAVELAVRSLGLPPGDSIALCGFDYPGNFRAIELSGYKPFLVDASKSGYSICPNQLSQLPSDAISAVLVSHLFGVPADVLAIREICDARNWKLIEDACQTPGMAIAGQIAGSWGDIGALSFGGSKPLTTGSGGALLTSDTRCWSRIGAYLDRPSDAIGLSELQAAALLPQLQRLKQCDEMRWDCVNTLLETVPWLADAMEGRIPGPEATFYKLGFLTTDREALLDHFRSAGLPSGSGYRSMHRSSRRRCEKLGELPQCQKLGDQVCLIDHRVLLSVKDQRAQLIKILQDARSFF